ncbi:MAG: hypothetical protein AAFZ05_02675 [Pseudomonadota bacterium]
MSPAKWIAAIAATGALIAITVFAQARYAQMADCRDGGGYWDGRASECRALPRIIIKRDLERI